MPSGSHIRRTIGRWFSGASKVDGGHGDEPLLVFVHIPKAAGTSCNDVFRFVYGRRFLNVSNHPKQWEARRVQASGISCLAGHFGYGWHRRIGRCGAAQWPKDGAFEGREIRYVSVVRDPVERTMSYFRYVQKEPKHRHHDAAKGMTAVAFFRYLAEIGDEGAWDIQHRMLGGMPQDRFHLIAPLERLEGFIKTLGNSLDWPVGVPVPHSNQTDSSDRSGFGEELVAMIEAKTGQDRKIYDEVCRRFEAGDFPAFRREERAKGG